MVAAGRGDNVALASNLAGEAGHWAGDLVDLAEEKNTGEAAEEWRAKRQSASRASIIGWAWESRPVSEERWFLTRLDTEEW